MSYKKALSRHETSVTTPFLGCKTIPFTAELARSCFARGFQGLILLVTPYL